MNSSCHSAVHTAYFLGSFLFESEILGVKLFSSKKFVMVFSRWYIIQCGVLRYNLGPTKAWRTSWIKVDRVPLGVWPRFIFIRRLFKKQIPRQSCPW